MILSRHSENSTVAFRSRAKQVDEKSRALANVLLVGEGH